MEHEPQRSDSISIKIHVVPPFCVILLPWSECFTVKAVDLRSEFNIETGMQFLVLQREACTRISAAFFERSLEFRQGVEYADLYRWEWQDIGHLPRMAEGKPQRNKDRKCAPYRKYDRPRTSIGYDMRA